MHRVRRHTVGVNTSRYSNPGCWEKPYATNQPLWHSKEPSAQYFLIKIHFDPITNQSLGWSTRVHVPFIWWAASSSKAACLHSAALSCFMASLNNLGCTVLVVKQWAISAFLSSESSKSLSTNCAGLGFHHSWGCWQILQGRHVLMPIGLCTGLGAGGGILGASRSGWGTASGALGSESWSPIGSGAPPGWQSALCLFF